MWCEKNSVTNIIYLRGYNLLSKARLTQHNTFPLTNQGLVGFVVRKKEN